MHLRKKLDGDADPHLSQCGYTTLHKMIKGWSFVPFLLGENVSWIPGPIAFTLGSGAAAHPEVVSSVGISRPVLK
jgi:hypothetical protein